MRVAVIGGGVFGATAALRLQDAGHSVTVFESRPGLLCGASRYGNRVHMGFHYPRHPETAEQCLRGYHRFKERFGEAILAGVTNAYAIAGEGSLTSADDFLVFCDGLGLPYREVGPTGLATPVDNVDVSILTAELMYDPLVLARMLTASLVRSGVDIRVGCAVLALARPEEHRFVVTTREGSRSFDAVVNCTYANTNRIAMQLGHAPTTRQYEYLAVPIIELEGVAAASITIMDGPFCCLLPYSSGGDHLLYHVDHSVIARQDAVLMDAAWLDAGTSPFARRDREEFFASMRSACAPFIPAVRHARLKGFAEAGRMVLDRIVTEREPGYVEVFSGKVDHCVWVEEAVAEILGTPSGASAPG